MDDEWQARQLANLATAYEAVDEPGSAFEALERAARVASSWDQRVMYMRRAAEVALSDPAFASNAPRLLDDELALRREHQDALDWAWAAAEMGVTLRDTEHAVHARHFYSAGLRVFARAGDAQRTFSVRNERAIVACDIGDYRAARADLRAPNPRICLAVRLAFRLTDTSVGGRTKATKPAELANELA